jgi:two-component system, OmpR family, response regulator
LKIGKVLVVDDDENIQLITQMGLEDRPDWQVIIASSGQEALEKAAAEKPDLVLLDIMMPDMDGKTTLAKLKEQETGASVPVIFLTAKVQNHEIESYVKIGAAGVITKPFDPMTLSAEICQIVGAD